MMGAGQGWGESEAPVPPIYDLTRAASTRACAPQKKTHNLYENGEAQKGQLIKLLAAPLDPSANLRSNFMSKQTDTELNLSDF
jgi:hypothetical protein